MVKVLLRLFFLIGLVAAWQGHDIRYVSHGRGNVIINDVRSTSFAEQSSGRCNLKKVDLGKQGVWFERFINTAECGGPNSAGVCMPDASTDENGRLLRVTQSPPAAIQPEDRVYVVNLEKLNSGNINLNSRTGRVTSVTADSANVKLDGFAKEIKIHVSFLRRYERPRRNDKVRAQIPIGRASDSNANSIIGEASNGPKANTEKRLRTAQQHLEADPSFVQVVGDDGKENANPASTEARKDFDQWMQKFRGDTERRYRGRLMYKFPDLRESNEYNKYLQFAKRGIVWNQDEFLDIFEQLRKGRQLSEMDAFVNNNNVPKDGWENLAKRLRKKQKKKKFFFKPSDYKFLSRHGVTLTLDELRDFYVPFLRNGSPNRDNPYKFMIDNIGKEKLDQLYSALCEAQDFKFILDDYIFWGLHEVTWTDEQVLEIYKTWSNKIAEVDDCVTKNISQEQWKTFYHSAQKEVEFVTPRKDYQFADGTGSMNISDHTPGMIEKRIENGSYIVKVTGKKYAAYGKTFIVQEEDIRKFDVRDFYKKYVQAPEPVNVYEFMMQEEGKEALDKLYSDLCQDKKYEFKVADYVFWGRHGVKWTLSQLKDIYKNWAKWDAHPIIIENVLPEQWQELYKVLQALPQDGEWKGLHKKDHRFFHKKINPSATGGDQNDDVFDMFSQESAGEGDNAQTASPLDPSDSWTEDILPGDVVSVVNEKDDLQPSTLPRGLLDVISNDQAVKNILNENGQIDLEDLFTKWQVPDINTDTCDSHEAEVPQAEKDLKRIYERVKEEAFKKTVNLYANEDNMSVSFSNPVKSDEASNESSEEDASEKTGLGKIEMFEKKFKSFAQELQKLRATKDSKKVSQANNKVLDILDKEFYDKDVLKDAFGAVDNTFRSFIEKFDKPTQYHKVKAKFNACYVRALAADLFETFWVEAEHHSYQQGTGLPVVQVTLPDGSAKQIVAFYTEPEKKSVEFDITKEYAYADETGSITICKNTTGTIEAPASKGSYVVKVTSGRHGKDGRRVTVKQGDIRMMVNYDKKESMYHDQALLTHQSRHGKNITSFVQMADPGDGVSILVKGEYGVCRCAEGRRGLQCEFESGGLGTGKNTSSSMTLVWIIVGVSVFLLTGIAVGVLIWLRKRNKTSLEEDRAIAAQAANHIKQKQADAEAERYERFLHDQNLGSANYLRSDSEPDSEPENARLFLPPLNEPFKDASLQVLQPEQSDQVSTRCYYEKSFQSSIAKSSSLDFSTTGNCSERTPESKADHRPSRFSRATTRPSFTRTDANGSKFICVGDTINERPNLKRLDTRTSFICPGHTGHNNNVDVVVDDAEVVPEALFSSFGLQGPQALYEGLDPITSTHSQPSSNSRKTKGHGNNELLESEGRSKRSIYFADEVKKAI